MKITLLLQSAETNYLFLFSVLNPVTLYFIHPGFSCKLGPSESISEKKEETFISGTDRGMDATVANSKAFTGNIKVNIKSKPWP